MTASNTMFQQLPPTPAQTPPLENGDRLTREEFERRFDAMPELKKAELIEGVVYVPSPVRFDRHGEQHVDLITWLGTYRMHTPVVRVGDNTTVRLDMCNEPQPDAMMIIDPARGGQARISADGYVELGPEFIGEIASSSVSIDLGNKLFVYLRNRVCEYLVWRVLDREIDWFILRQDRYDRLPRTADGLYKSEVFPGLWLDTAALVCGDLPRVHQVLHLGLASPEHRAFIERLQRASVDPTPRQA